MASFKTSYVCPFCDLNFIASKTLQDHIGECGNSLIICAECGIAIQRRTILNHQNACPALLKKQIKYLFEKDASDTEKLKSESFQLQNQLQLSEQRNQIFTAALHTIKTKLEEHQSLFCDQQDVIQELCSAITRIEEKFDSLKEIIDQDRVNHSHLELIVNSQDSKIRSFSKHDDEIIGLRDKIGDQNKMLNEELEQIQTKLNHLTEEISNIDSLRKQEDDKERQNKIDEKFAEIENEISKIKLLKYDSKDMKTQIQEQLLKICETNEKMNTIEDKISILDSKIPTTFYSNLAESNVTPKSGHLVWRIDDFENKMKESVDNKTAIYSPKFFSHEFGYALQAEVHLNGLGRWRGRHITASVFLIDGEYDPILPWPVSLHADIILKDQTPNRQEAIDAIKSLVIKRKETSIIEKRRSGTLSLEKSKSGQTLDENIRRQYVFIPHASLDKLDYIKNDVMFIEVVIKK